MAVMKILRKAPAVVQYKTLFISLSLPVPQRTFYFTLSLAFFLFMKSVVHVEGNFPAAEALWFSTMFSFGGRCQVATVEVTCEDSLFALHTITHGVDLGLLNAFMMSSL